MDWIDEITTYTRCLAAATIYYYAATTADGINMSFIYILVNNGVMTYPQNVDPRPGRLMLYCC